MFQYSVYYPKTAGASFDHDYYRDHHVPMVTKIFGLDSAVIERGVDGPHEAACHFLFATREDCDAAFERAAEAGVSDDIKNYTSIVPVRQLSEVIHQ